MKKQTKITILDNGFNRFQTRCQKCGCKFEYDIKSLKRSNKYYGVKCPICGNMCEHSLDRNVRKDDVISKYKKQIIDELKKELVPEVEEQLKNDIRYQELLSIINRLDSMSIDVNVPNVELEDKTDNLTN